MKKAKNLEIGKVVQVPTREFAPLRRGWNGWLFDVGIVKGFGTSKNGMPLIKVEYPTRSYGQKWKDFRGNDRIGERNTIIKWFPKDAVFEADLTFYKNQLEYPREKYMNGCYCEGLEFLLDKGILNLNPEV